MQTSQAQSAESPCFTPLPAAQGHVRGRRKPGPLSKQLQINTVGFLLLCLGWFLSCFKDKNHLDSSPRLKVGLMNWEEEEGKCLTVKISFFQGPYLKTHSGRGENRVLLKISWSKFFLWVLSMWRSSMFDCRRQCSAQRHLKRGQSLGFILVAFLIVSQNKYFSKIFIFHFYML